MKRVNGIMSLIDIEALRATPLKTDPYEYLVVPAFVTGKALALWNVDSEVAEAVLEELRGLEHIEGVEYVTI